MIYELRTYTLQPGTQAQYLKNSAEIGRKIRGDKYGKFEGGWYTEFGTLNQYVHLWSFENLNERGDFAPRSRRTRIGPRNTSPWPAARSSPRRTRSSRPCWR